MGIILLNVLFVYVFVGIVSFIILLMFGLEEKDAIIGGLMWFIFYPLAIINFVTNMMDIVMGKKDKEGKV